MAKQRPIVTALVPSYNHGRYIRERIESIVKQTYQHIELIVIDDCSQDDSENVILELQKQYHFKYLRNSVNSGTPFSSWEKICELATGEYIWVCESDDVAELNFLDVAVSSLEADSTSILFYCNSAVIDEEGRLIGNTSSYFHDVWRESRWDNDFIANGFDELKQFQLRGQIVPNMSSALFRIDAFRASFTPFLKQLRLTGDWLFVGNALTRGNAIFSHSSLSRFRKHEVTSRVRVKSARSQAEFILTKYHLFKMTKQNTSVFASVIGTDVIRFLYEPTSWFDVFKALFQVSKIDTLRVFALLCLSVPSNMAYIKKFKERYKHSKEWKKEHEKDHQC